ncbi:MAG: hypothetical protein AB9Q22_13470 [Candidatus Reddybacter sp.]
MSSGKDAEQALGALARHASLVVDSHINNHGEIENSPENDKAIKLLKKHRLVWHSDDIDEARLSNAVSMLLDNTLQNHRRHIANEAVAELWDHL